MARCCSPLGSTITPAVLAFAARKAAFACGLSELSAACAGATTSAARPAARMAIRIIRDSPLTAPCSGRQQYPRRAWIQRAAGLNQQTVAILGPVVGVGAVIWRGPERLLLARRGQPPRLGEWSIPGGRVEAGGNLRAGFGPGVGAGNKVMLAIPCPDQWVVSC